MNFYFFKKIFRRDTRKTLVIFLSGGLCNRLCTLISTQIACKEKKKNLKIVWRKNRYCGCDFKDIFVNDFDVIEAADTFDFDDWNRFDHYLSSEHKTMFYVDFWFRPFEKVLMDVEYAKFDMEVPKKYLKKFTQELKSFKLVDTIEQKIMPVSKNTIGVHIRKSDFLNKSKKLNYNWFEQKMYEEVQKDNQVLFFLATDCNETRNHMIKIFGTKILYYPFNFNVDDKNFLQQRSDTVGIQEAVMDLVTLSKTKKIIGSYKSSFSWIAGMWGDVPVECER